MLFRRWTLFRLFSLVSLSAGVNLAFASTTPPSATVIPSTGASEPAEVKAAEGKNPFSINITLGFPAAISEKHEITPAVAVRDSNVFKPEENTAKTRIYEYGFNSDPGSVLARHHTNAALRQAMNLDADLVYIHLNPFADFDGAATDIRNELTEFNKPMTVFIDNGTKGSGTIISLRADSSVKNNRPNQVKTSVYTLSGKQFEEKYKTYVNAIVNNTASKQAPRLSAGGSCISTLRTPATGHSANQLTTSSNERSANNIVLFNYQPSLFEKILDFLLQPFVSFLLIFIMGMGLLLELQRPGTGFPLFASVGAALLFFIPLHLDACADMREIFLVIGGISILLIQRIWLTKNTLLGPAGMIIAGAGLVFCLSPFFLVPPESAGGWMQILQPFVLVTASFATTWFAYRFMTRHRLSESEPTPAGKDDFLIRSKRDVYPSL
jgi:membrane-bound serine protease (ClpP class)